MERRRIKRIVMLAVMALLFFMFVGCQKKEEQDQKSFFELIGMKKDEIQTVYIEHNGVRIPMEESSKDRMLSSLELAQPGGRLSLEPFTKSEYQLVLETEQEVKPIDFCWFIGKEYDEEYHMTGYSDRRFDVQVGDDWYLFRQDQDIYWNEDLLETSFHRLAQRNGVQVPKRYERDGYDGEAIQFGGYGAVGYQIAEKRAEDLLQRSAVAMLGSLQGYEEVQRGAVKVRIPLVQVEEVLKGDMEEDAVLVETGTRVVISNDKKIVSYPCREEADLMAGRLYLLCLQEQDEDGIYQLVDEVCGTGVVVDGAVYPRYNTETHPLYGQPLKKIRKYAAEN